MGEVHIVCLWVCVFRSSFILLFFFCCFVPCKVLPIPFATDRLWVTLLKCKTQKEKREKENSSSLSQLDVILYVCVCVFVYLFVCLFVCSGDCLAIVVLKVLSQSPLESASSSFARFVYLLCLLNVDSRLMAILFFSLPCFILLHLFRIFTSLRSTFPSRFSILLNSFRLFLPFFAFILFSCS